MGPTNHWHFWYPFASGDHPDGHQASFTTTSAPAWVDSSIHRPCSRSWRSPCAPGCDVRATPRITRFWYLKILNRLEHVFWEGAEQSWETQWKHIGTRIFMLFWAPTTPWLQLPRWTVSDRLTHWHGGSVALQDSYDLSDAGARLVPVDPGSWFWRVVRICIDGDLYHVGTCIML